MKEFITTILTFVIYIASFLSYGLGIFHSFKKHGVADGIIGTIAFPWAIYRGAEFWWHDETGDVVWEKRLPNDMYSLAYFISSIGESNSEKIKINEEIEKFSAKINKYPDDKKKFLATGTRKLILYTNSLGKIFLISLNNYKNSGNISLETNVSTKNLENQLFTYYLKDVVDNSQKAMDEMIGNLKKDLPSDKLLIDESQINSLEQQLRLKMEYQTKESNRIFKLIFNEDL